MGDCFHRDRRRDAYCAAPGTEGYGRISFRTCLARLLASSRADQLPPWPAFLRGGPRTRTASAAVLVPRRRVGVRLAMGILELLGPRRLGLHFSDRPAMENFPDARAGLPCFPGVCARMFRDVRVRRVARQPKIHRREKIFGIAG